MRPLSLKDSEFNYIPRLGMNTNFSSSTLTSFLIIIYNLVPPFFEFSAVLDACGVVNSYLCFFLKACFDESFTRLSGVICANMLVGRIVRRKHCWLPALAPIVRVVIQIEIRRATSDYVEMVKSRVD